MRGCDIRHSDLADYDRCDVAEYRQLEELFDKYPFDYVYHAAAEFGRNNGETTTRTSGERTPSG